MTLQERLLALLRGEISDCIPVCPDIPNMVPARPTNKPFWDIYVYQDPPSRKAHTNSTKYFGLDRGSKMKPTIIDPLEVPSMGDCSLAELQQLYDSVLSTDDQCGRDRPDENIFARVQVDRIQGRY
jgi:hypothetical protein